MRRRPLAIAALVLFACLPAHRAGASHDPHQGSQWALGVVKAPAAWPTATGKGAVIAIVDSGVDAEHPEFAGKLVDGANFVGCEERRPCGSWDDTLGHGTHVAGIAAAGHNVIGIVGVAPAAKIMPVRVLGPRGASTADISDGIRYAVDRGAHVVNVSLGGYPILEQALHALGDSIAAAVSYALSRGVVVTIAAGNELAPICDEDFGPATEGALCVGAVDRAKRHAWYSNWGIGLDVVAPGGFGSVFCDDTENDVLSTFPVGMDDECENARPGYTAEAGTSMAAPHVAGVAALLAEKGVRGAAAVARIKATAENLGPATLYGAGLVNAAAAVAG